MTTGAFQNYWTLSWNSTGIQLQTTRFLPLVRSPAHGGQFELCARASDSTHCDASVGRIVSLAIASSVCGALERGGVLVKEDEQAYFDLPLDSPLEQLSAAAVRYRIAVGPQAGCKTMTLHSGEAQSEALPLAKPFTVARDGLSINCAVSCEANERDKLERLCRYMSRPAIPEQRLSVDGDGLVVCELKRPFRDGTTHVLFEPHDFITRLAALVARPRTHLIRYHGMFAPNARNRRLIVKAKRANRGAKDLDEAEPADASPLSTAPTL